MPSPEDQLLKLDHKLQAQQLPLRILDQYYSGEQPLKYMAPALEAEFGGRVTQLVINWPEMVADAYEARLDVTGFRLAGGDGEADEDAWDVWTDNDMDEQAPLATLESIALGRSYAIVGTDDDGAPIITVEHPTQCITEADPRTRRQTSGLKRWKNDEGVHWGTLYLPDETRYFYRAREWKEDTGLRDQHGLGVLPVEVLRNRGRMMRDLGRSEFASILPVADAANKIATDMMISAEFHGMPRRWIFGMSEKDFVDEHGNPLTTWQQIAGRLWATDKHPDEVKAGQFPESDLQVFHGTIRVLAQLAAQLAALPPHYMSFTTENPASADAIRSSEAQLVKRAERKQTALGASWRRVMALALRIRDGLDEAPRLETIWRDASTPTVVQSADAAVKRFQAGISTLRQTREDCGYTPGQIRRMQAEDEEAAARDPLGQIARDLSTPVAAEPQQEPELIGAGSA